MYWCYTFIITTVSYQYCSYLYYCEIHLRIYIYCYCLFTYVNSILFIMFILNCCVTLLFSKILNMFICGIFDYKVFALDKEIHNLRFLLSTTTAKTKFMLPGPSDHWKMELYHGLADSGKGDLDSDINCLDSGNLWQYPNVPSQCEQFSWTWTGRLPYFDCWSYFKKFLDIFHPVTCKQLPLQ